MGQKTTVVIEDDLDGAQGAKERDFGIDGMFYKIDLTDDNYAKLTAALTDYVAAGRRATAPKPRTSYHPTKSAERAANRERNRQIREWCKVKGITLNGDRGRIPHEVLKLWDEDQNKDTDAPTAPVAAFSG
jgi:hypothetical protein